MITYDTYQAVKLRDPDEDGYNALATDKCSCIEQEYANPILPGDITQLQLLSDEEGSTNLLSNGDFELGSGNTFTSWTIVNGPNSVVVETTDGGYNGTRAPQLVVNVVGSGSRISQAVSLETKKTYIVRFWAKVESDAAVQRSLAIRYDLYDYHVITLNDTLTEYSLIFTTGATITDTNFTFQHNSSTASAGDRVTIDHVRLYEKTDENGFLNHIGDPDFEQNDGDFSVRWIPVESGSSTATIGNGEGLDGSDALKLTIDGSASNTGFLQEFTTMPGKQYVLSFYAKINSTLAGDNLNAKTGTTDHDFTLTTEYVKYKFTFLAGTNQDLTFENGPDSASRTMWVDQVELYRVDARVFVHETQPGLIVGSDTIQVANEDVVYFEDGANYPIDWAALNVDGEFLNPGCYYIEVRLGSSGSAVYAVSEDYKYITEEDGCTTLLEWYDDADVYGINYTSGFKNSLRIEGNRLFGPKYPFDKSVLNQNNETLQINQAAVKKQFTLSTGPVPEYILDRIVVALQHNHFLVNETEYWNMEEDGTYEPQAGNNLKPLEVVLYKAGEYIAQREKNC